MAYNASPESSPAKAASAQPPASGTTYVRPYRNSAESLIPALGHIGVVEDAVHGRPGANRLSGFITARFIIDGESRTFKCWGYNYEEIDAGKVPTDIREALAATASDD